MFCFLVFSSFLVFRFVLLFKLGSCSTAWTNMHSDWIREKEENKCDMREFCVLVYKHIVQYTICWIKCTLLSILVDVCIYRLSISCMHPAKFETQFLSFSPNTINWRMHSRYLCKFENMLGILKYHCGIGDSTLIQKLFLSHSLAVCHSFYFLRLATSQREFSTRSGWISGKPLASQRHTIDNFVNINPLLIRLADFFADVSVCLSVIDTFYFFLLQFWTFQCW